MTAPDLLERQLRASVEELAEKGVERPIADELAALGVIIHALNAQSEVARERMLRYLNDRFLGMLP